MAWGFDSLGACSCEKFSAPPGHYRGTTRGHICHDMANEATAGAEVRMTNRGAALAAAVQEAAPSAIDDLTAKQAEQLAALDREDEEGEGTAAAEATPESTPTPEASPASAEEGAPQEVQSETTEEPPEATPEGEGTGTEAPTSYFEVDLSMVPAEERPAIIEALRKRDDAFGKLLRKKAEEGTTPTPTPTPQPEPVEELSDADILQRFGLDPESPFDEKAAAVALQLTREGMETRSVLNQVVDALELAQVDRTWRTGLAAMEKEFGALPGEITHEDVMEFAAENEVLNPMDAYWRIVGPARQTLTAAVREHTEAQAKELLERKKAVATVRPAATEAPSEPEVEGQTVRAAAAEVARATLEKLGIG